MAAIKGREDRYRATEQELWGVYGVEPSEQFVEVESPAVRLRVVEAGSGNPVLFVHGTPGTGPYWAPLVSELRGHRCLMLDRPGWGLSAAIDYSKYEFKSVVAEVLKGVLDELEIDRADMVGNSIGCVWVLRLAQRYPSRVGRIALMGGGPLLPEVPVPPIVRLIASPVGALMVHMPQKAPRERAIMRSVGHGPSLDAGHIPSQYFDWKVALNRCTDWMPNERNMIRTLVRGRSFRRGLTFDDAELAAIRQPTLLVYGTGDPAAPIEVWKRFTGLLPNGEMHLVEDGGHMPWLDDPAGVGNLVARFFSG